MSRDSSSSRKRRSFAGSAFGAMGRVLAWSTSVLPKREVLGAGREIGTLLAGVRANDQRDRRLRTCEDGSFDLVATAFCYGISVWDLEQRLARRRKETALAAYMFFGAGWVCFVFWLYRIATADMRGWRMATLIEFAPFCLLLFLMAFRSALQNYQIRARRLASAGEYLTTNDEFWPS